MFLFLVIFFFLDDDPEEDSEVKSAEHEGSSTMETEVDFTKIKMRSDVSGASVEQKDTSGWNFRFYGTNLP